MRRSVPFVILALALSACEMAPDEVAPAGEPGEIEVLQGAATVVSICRSLRVVRGGIGSGQSAATLATRDLSGTQDVWAGGAQAV